MTVEIWYRYEDVRYAPPADEFGDPGRGEGSLEVHQRRFKVVKHTPKGVWLSRVWGHERDGENSITSIEDERRFILRDAGKRFACPTVDEAKVSFIARKTRQAQIHEARARQAREAIRLVTAKDQSHAHVTF